MARKNYSPDALFGMIGTTLGGGCVGAAIQRTQLFGNKLSSGLSKLAGKGSIKLDETTWALFAVGAVLLATGVFFTLRRR